MCSWHGYKSSRDTMSLNSELVPTRDITGCDKFQSRDITSCDKVQSRDITSCDKNTTLQCKRVHLVYLIYYLLLFRMVTILLFCARKMPFLYNSQILVYVWKASHSFCSVLPCALKLVFNTRKVVFNTTFLATRLFSCSTRVTVNLQ